MVLNRLTPHLPVGVVEAGGAGDDLGGEARRCILDLLGLFDGRCFLSLPDCRCCSFAAASTIDPIAVRGQIIDTSSRCASLSP